MTKIQKLSMTNDANKMSINACKRYLFACLFLVSTNSIGATPGWLQNLVTSCEAGVTKDCLSAAVAYKKGELNGKKVTRDLARSKRFSDKAVRSGDQNCKQGDALDCYTIGLLYFEGGGVIPTDIPRGLDYLQRSCKGGYKQACDWLDRSGLRM